MICLFYRLNLAFPRAKSAKSEAHEFSLPRA
jgi:hypothetical protein